MFGLGSIGSALGGAFGFGGGGRGGIRQPSPPGWMPIGGPQAGGFNPAAIGQIGAQLAPPGGLQRPDQLPVDPAMAAGQLGQQMGQFGLGQLGRGTYQPSPWMGYQQPQGVNQEDILRQLGIDPSRLRQLHGQVGGLTPLSGLMGPGLRGFF